MNSARALIAKVRAEGVTMIAEGDRLRLVGPRPLAAPVLRQVRENKSALVIELKAETAWWMDAEAISTRFEEIAGYLHFDCGVPAGAMKLAARISLATELREHGLDAEAMASALGMLAKVQSDET